ncbi:uncharacterized protein KY384_006407 [Bacidia gigantensis]|uniref:uncharacterized protein n=1 Tax=Bacidia gigantensis TaxID=2732470 RepID=UPI001D0539FC|nr:uncharacterized protein KY384_006407 [Bacidia gigantensis]KAG8528720.1 hypothetical protein KY384_006407 [Bacidia gigantensis]
MHDIHHPAYKKLEQIGREITTVVKPKAVIVLSAHWQATARDTIEINTSNTMDLIYDHYYREKYPNRGSQPLADHFMTVLSANGINTRPVARGLDHGVWVSFKVAFNPDTNPLHVPIVQVSLFSSDHPRQHYALGRALSSLRSEGNVVIATGMAVHNLRDLRKTMGNPAPLPYASSFDEALREAVESDSVEREERMISLLGRSDASQAHPTLEHLLPIFVGAGAASTERGMRLWTLPEGSTSWAMYRFGAVPTFLGQIDEGRAKA